MLRITFFYFTLTFLSLIECKFSNIVQYPDLTQKVFKYDLHFKNGLSMSVNNKINSEFDPVDFNLTDGRFYVRDKDPFNACSLNKLLTNQEDLDSIVTVDGRHGSMIFVNDQFPGPPIVVSKGSQIEITVHNHFRSEILSVHWHGQTQLNSFQMDGVSRITQCGIQPGETFTYKFTANDHGTHWYHSHSSVQRTDGAIGPLVVIDFNQNISKYEQEFYFFVQDWQHLRSEDTVNLPIWGNTKFWNGYQPGAQCFSPLRIKDGSMMMMKPDSFIINGKGWHDLPIKIDFLNSFTESANKLPLERFKVKSNRKYLFRVIGSNMAFPIMISVNGHKINLVSSDGNAIKPINDLDYVIVNGGERYDFELETKETNEFNFYILIQAVASLDYNFNGLNRDFYGIAILEYENAKNLTYIKRECTNKNPCLASNCPYLSNENSEIKCINFDKMQSADEVISDLDRSQLFKTNYESTEFEEHFFNFHFSGEHILRASINGKEYKLPNMPPFFPKTFEEAIAGNECDCIGEQTCHCSSRTQISPGKVIQFVVYNMGKGAGVQGTAHPVHLHGHHFYVIKVGYPEYYSNNSFAKNNKDLLCKEDDSEFCNNIVWTSSANKYGNINNANLINPIRKDTILVPVGGYAVIRFYSNNVGYWFFHCHIEVHATEGMATLIQEGTDEQIRNSVDWNNMHSCSKGYIRSGVNYKDTFKRNNSTKSLNYNLFLMILLIILNN